MHSSQLLNVLRHVPPEMEVPDIELVSDSGTILASAAWDNVTTGKAWNDGAVVPPPGEEIIP